MNDGEMAPPAAAKRPKTSPYMPHELVSEILVRLPVDSLTRFGCVCKAWRRTISSDASFHRSHLRLQKPCMLLSPFSGFNRHDDGRTRMRKVGFYRWDASQGTKAPLVYTTELPSADTMHRFAHCDGLVLVPAEAAVLLLNPATRRVLALPQSPGCDKPRRDLHNTNFFLYSHQAFGLGRDPRSNAHKVARFFYRTAPAPGDYHYTTVRGDYHYTVGMEVFTIGVDRHWRETAARPPYPAMTRRAATSFEGSLLWIIDERALGKVAPGFLRFDLADETFGLTPLPPWHPISGHTTMALSGLRGELLVARVHNDVEMWMCDDVDNPRWELRHKVVLSMWSQHIHPIGVFDDEIVFQDEEMHLLVRYDRQAKCVKALVGVMNLRYHNASTGMLEYRSRRWSQLRGTLPSEQPLDIFTVDVIPYVPSLIPI